MKTKIILAVIIAIVAIAFYNHHKDTERALYAQTHNCEWTVYASHDICK